MHMQQRPIGLIVALVAMIATGLVASCAEARETRSITLAGVKSSGVAGNVTLTDVGDGRTRVDVEVDPAGNLDMPAHIHPGICGNITPQPRFPLANVANGHASTVVPASLAELMTGNLAVTLHKSNEDLKITTACGTLVVG